MRLGRVARVAVARAEHVALDVARAELNGARARGRLRLQRHRRAVGRARARKAGAGDVLASVWIDGRMVTDVPAEPSDEPPHRYSRTGQFNTKRDSK